MAGRSVSSACVLLDGSFSNPKNQCQRLFFIRYRSWSAADSATSSLSKAASPPAHAPGGGPSIANDSAQNHPCLLRVGTRQKQRELVATEPRDHVGCAQPARQGAGHADEKFVTGDMSVLVVVRLEVVNVDQSDSDRIARPLGVGAAM